MTLDLILQGALIMMRLTGNIDPLRRLYVRALNALRAAPPMEARGKRSKQKYASLG